MAKDSFLFPVYHHCFAESHAAYQNNKPQKRTPLTVQRCWQKNELISMIPWGNLKHLQLQMSPQKDVDYD